MKGLFRGFDVTNKDQLKDKFYKTVNKILKMVNTKQFIIRTIFSSETIFSKILSVVMSIAMISGYCLGLRNVVFYTPTIYRIAFVLAIIACGVIMFFDHYMPKRTEYGTEVLGRLRGFRTFLQTAEKDRLETMVEREPQYFYNILPCRIYGWRNLNLLRSNHRNGIHLMGITTRLIQCGSIIS